MLRPSFETVSLRYGCHEGEWDFPAHDRPVVVAGPNGSGKTTLVDGLIRTLFGFDRRRGEDVAEMEARRPWGREGMRGRVVLTRNGDRFEIQRDFSTDRVRVSEPVGGVEHFVGDGNPAARNQEARHYRQILSDLLGLQDMNAYRQTLLVRQGDLPGTALGEHLLRVAAGGHARVEAARWQIAQAHRAITRRPLHAGAAAAINPREMEKLDEEIAAVRARLEEARTAGERRAPLALDRDQVSNRMVTLDNEIELLEDALTALARTDATELSTRHLRQQARLFREAADTLREAITELDGAREAQREALGPGRYPDDFSERLARADVRWDDLEELRRPPAPWLGLIALAVLAGAAALYLFEYPFRAAIIAGVGAVGGVVWGALWAWARHRYRKARKEVYHLLGGVPQRESLGPDTRAEALARFRAQRAADRRLVEARGSVAEALWEGRAALADSIGVTAGATDGGGDRTRDLLARLEAAAEESSERLAMGRIELDRIGDLSLALPDDVPPTEEAVAAALRDRRAERSLVQASYQNVSQELLERGTPSESVEALESKLASMEPRVGALGRKAKVLEAAHALIADAYDQFRDRDQDRLAGRVSEHARRLTDGSIEGIQVEDSLDEALVCTRGRLTPMTTPPLSFGEFHSLQLAVRLGAADFLAGIGIHPPLIIDEPFAHLDAERAMTVWGLLADLAPDRQVVITTQDARLLEDLDIEPDIVLGPRPPATGPSP